MVSKQKTSSSKQRETNKTATTKLTDYEMQRQMTIEQNVRFKKLGLCTVANELMKKAKGRQTKRQDNQMHVDEEDQEYIPEEDCDDVSTDPEEEPIAENVVLDSTSNRISDKVDRMTTRKRAASGEKKNHPLCPAMSLVDFLKQQTLQESTQLVENEGAIQDQGQICTRQNSSGCELENLEDTPEQPKDNVKRHRGPTMLFNVHARELDERVPVFFNEHGQPIGPTEKVCNEFSQILGTIAHEHSWAPLTYTNWHKVPEKDRIWEFVNTKYVLPKTECVRKWVLETIGSAWRCFKCRLKAKHYYKYNNDKERLKNRPNRVPESHFKLLLEYWKTGPVKKISAQNSENRELPDNMHTTGPVSFARIYHKLEKDDGEPPSKRKMFEATRKRKDGREYKKAYDDTLQKIEKMKEIEVLHETGLSDCDGDPFDIVMNNEHHRRPQLYGRGVSMKKLKEKEVGKSIIVPEEYVNSVRSSLATEMQKDYEAQKEKLTNQFEAQFSKLDAMSKELEAKKDNMVDDVVAKTMEKLREMCPNITVDMLGQAVASSLHSSCAPHH